MTMTKAEHMPQVGPITISYGGKTVVLPEAPADVLAEEFVDAIMDLAGLRSKPAAVQPMPGPVGFGHRFNPDWQDWPAVKP